MRGLIFTEFMDYVEARFGLGRVEAVLDAIAASDGGAYTAVDNYPAQELYAMLAAVARQEHEDAEALLVDYGRHLFGVFLTGHPEYFGALQSTAALMERVEDHIHIEVKKLHPDAKPPRFRTQGGNGEWTVRYYSHRPLHALAHGLMEASAVHFGERLRIVREVADGAQDLQAVFRLLDLSAHA
ncbi:MAG: heme NO-binding domain-containing protein [Pseudomonadota bacterium]